ncbi:MAG: SUMF1/EgtB/PvdO family nonheme iron enzyme, partial [Planctomycetales bacterium]|nr:SUMF1/EgtB/PvdO family nonheme iron enzyme [Planctomycetales bacterium]
FVNGRGIVHRDVKPENLLLFQGQVKLIDFGFARLSEISSATNSVLGTPIFAPAEANDGRLNPNVDIYCLAGTFIRLLTGQYPFGGNDDLRQRKRDGCFHTEGLLPHEIEALRGALAADPRERPFESASDFVAALTVPPPPVFVPSGTSPPTITATQPVRPAGSRSFVDKIRQIVSREESERAQATAAAADRLAQLRQQFTELLHKQLDTGDFALAYGTVSYLLRGQMQQVQANELSEVKQFLESRDAHGRVRGEDECGIRFALIPPGAFAMGSPFDEEGHEQNEFPHRVLLTKPYYMAIHPTTVGQFSEFVHATAHKTDDNESWRDPGFTQDKTHPVVNVSHDDATAFCNWMSKRTGKRYGLPTEAQWEYAARAGTTTRYWWGDTITPNHANFSESGINGTTPVGKYAANPWGLFDVSGNA